MLELRAVNEGVVPASAPATSRLFVLPVAARRWVSTDNKYFCNDVWAFPLRRELVASSVVLPKPQYQVPFVEVSAPNPLCLISLQGLLVAC